MQRSDSKKCGYSNEEEDSKGEVVASATVRPSCQDGEGLEEGPGTLEPPAPTGQHLERMEKRGPFRLSKNYHKYLRCSHLFGPRV